MPTLKISTNVHKANVPDNFLHEASEAFQKVIGKPMKYIQVVLLTDIEMVFGNTTEPCACVEVMSIGKLGSEENKTISKVVFDLLAKLNIPGDRAYVVFTDKPPHEVGYSGTTFEELLAKK